MKENTTPMQESAAEIVPAYADTVGHIMDGIRNASSDIYASFTAETHADRIKLYNATAGEGQTLKENLNKVLEVVDVVIMPVDVMNDDGTTSTVPRTTLITKKGDCVSATSWGIYNSVKKIMGIFGSLHFDEPLKVSPVEVKTKNGFTMNLRLQ